MADFLQLSQLKKFPNLLHAFSTRKAGSLGNPEFANRHQRLIRFLRQFSVDINDCVAMNQVHDDTIVIVRATDKGSIIQKTDGLITKEKKLFLLIKTADCLPGLFFDPVNQIVGVAHLGWKGVLLGLGGKMIEKMVELGSDRKDIMVGVGSGIGRCCYDVPLKRVQRFKRKFSCDSKFYQKEEGRYYLDLKYLLRKQLLLGKLKPNKIEFVNQCTSCSHDQFFSFRRGDKDKTCLGLIGIQSNE